MIDKRYPYKSSAVIPPGETIRDTIQYRGMSEAELAEQLGLSREHVAALVAGTADLTADIAVGLERVLGVPAHMWESLERDYQELRSVDQTQGQVTTAATP
ncbi:MAG: helix-turn-helix domain-containing protein [Armatimonadetes bacterium]|nr:helix-turn-helix domain-containing protein [Armatimonadota bacterium]